MAKVSPGPEKIPGQPASGEAGVIPRVGETPFISGALRGLREAVGGATMCASISGLHRHRLDLYFENRTDGSVFAWVSLGGPMVVNNEKNQRIEKKRRLILDTALRIFAREGYADADVQVIADLAGVGKGTVYRHFGNKQELFLATARHSQEQMGDFIREQVDPEAPTIQVLRGVAVAYARYFELHPEAVEIMIAERATFRNQVFPTHLMYRDEQRAEFETFLQQAVERGDLKPIPVSDLSDAFGDLLYGTVVNGCLEGSKGNLLDRVQRRIEIFLTGVLPAGGTA